MRNRGGQYAERGGVFLPIVRRLDLSITQDFFTDLGGKRHGFQIRADFINFGNLLNDKWGVGPLDLPPGRREQRAGQQVVRVDDVTTNNSDVYQFMISLRYSFN